MEIKQCFRYVLIRKIANKTVLSSFVKLILSSEGSEYSQLTAAVSSEQCINTNQPLHITNTMHKIQQMKVSQSH